MKVLFATDGSQCSDIAAREIINRPWPTGTELRIISAVEPFAGPAPETGLSLPEYYGILKHESIGVAKQAIEHTVAVMKCGHDLPFTVTTCISEGQPRRVILEEAKRWGADLILVGAHDHSAFDKLLFGSVSSYVAGHADCSVEIARCHNHV
jgi:nucleotide-binding universal stress UspA family protein